MKLNLGACDRQFSGFLSVDIVPPADQIVDLSQPWPWDTDSIEEIVALDVIEHIGDADPHDLLPARRRADHLDAMIQPSVRAWRAGSTDFRSWPVRHPSGRIHFMNEMHRVLQHGARAHIETPNASKGAGFFQDPTHRSPWCLNSFQYFETGSFAHTRLAKAYGISAEFRILELSERCYRDVLEEVWKITAILEAVKT